MAINEKNLGKFGEKAIAEISREELKSLFYALSGKPDSVLKVFDDPVVISRTDLQELDQQIKDKLAHYYVEAVTTTIDISFEGGLVKQFGNWSEFESAPLNGPEVTEAIMVRWDMLVNLPDYKIPQRHTVTLRATSTVKPSQIMQYLLSTDPADVDKVDYEMSPIFCRVDFINYLMSQEILNIVVNWYKARPKPIVYSSVYYKIRAQRKKIAKTIEYLLPALVALLSIALLIEITSGMTLFMSVNLFQMRLLIIWLFSSGLVVYMARKFGYLFAGKSFNSLRNFGAFGVFDLTRGDRNKQSEIEQKNADAVRSFFISTGTAFVIDLVTGVAIAALLN